MAKRKSKNNPKTKHLLAQCVHPHAAGIDIGAEELVAAVPPGHDDEPVRTFSTFTEGIHALRDWLLRTATTTVAMESTGTYWVAAYEILEAAGIEVCLVNARHVKGVPGKKTDVCDAQWLQQLHAAGLLRASFRPPSQVVAVRQLVRHRSQLVGDASRHLQHMQKALTEMNLKIHHVFSDLDGVSAMRIIEAILGGQRDPGELWKLRDNRCRTSKATFLAAVEGDWQPSGLFILRQCHTAWGQARAAITECDATIQALMAQVPDGPAGTPPADPPTRRRTSKNDLGFDIYAEAHRFYGVDLTTISGVSGGTLAVLTSELGNASDILSGFRSAKAFASWLGLCPDRRISGGRTLRSKTRRVVNRVAAALRMAAQSLTHAKCALGDYCRRMKARLGKAEGTTAVAHKLARLIYALIQSRRPYDEARAFPPTARSRKRRLNALLKLAKSLDMQVVPA